MDVILVVLQARQRLIDVGTRPLDDESTKVLEYVVQILGRPHARGAHCLNEVCPSQKGNAHLLLVPVDILYAANDVVDLVVEVIEHLCGRNIVGLYGLPGIACKPLGGLAGGETAHLDTVLCGSQTRLLVGIGDG